MKNILKKILRNENGLLYFIIFTTIFFALSVYRHISFQSGSLDLGSYTQTAWLFSEFKTPINTVLDNRHFLGDHFDLLIGIIGIFYKLVPSPIFLLFLQSIFVASMVIPATLIYNLYVKKNKLLYHLLMLTLLINIPVINTILYDFRPYVMAASLILWVLYFFEKQNFKLMFILFFVMLISKESVGPFGVFLGLYFISRKEIKVGIATILLSSVTFYLAQGIIMPMFMDGKSIHLQYPELGGSLKEIIYTISTNPLLPVSILLRPEFISYYLVTFMRFPLIVLTPMAWLIIIPNFLERFLSSKQAMWTDSFHYGFILAPLAIYISIISLSKLKAVFKKSDILNGRLLLFLIVIPSFIFNLYQVVLSPNSRISELNPNVRNVVVNYNKQTKFLKDNIPNNASVTAQDYYVPHLANREKIYKLNSLDSAKYVVINENLGYWPLTSEEYADVLNKLSDNEKYIQTAKLDSLTIFMKVSNPDLDK